MRRRATRRLGGVALVLVLATGAVLGLVALISARDRSALSGLVAPGPGGQPGVPQRDRGDRHLSAARSGDSGGEIAPTSGPHAVVALLRDGIPLSSDVVLSALERGDVVIVYRDPRVRVALHELAGRLAGPFTPSLAAAGEAVLLDPQPRASRGGIIALAWRRTLHARSAADPGLGSFVSYWLGRGAPGRTG